MIPSWLMSIWLQLRIASAKHDLQRYVDDEKHAQRQQFIVAEYLRDAESQLAQCRLPTTQGMQ